MKNPVLLATLALVGTIVGAGIFGVPYIFAQSGIWVGLAYCAVLGAATVLIHWHYALVAADTPGKHRLVGYVRQHLGARAAAIVSVTNPLNLLGSLLAYLILGGEFLATIFGGSATFWGLGFFLVMGLVLVLPFRRLEKIEGWLTWFLIVVALGIVVTVAPHIRLDNLLVWRPANWFLPFGIIFFSFGGASVIPDIVETLKKRRASIASAIVTGTVFSVLLTAAFGLAIAGATGSATSPNAIAGLVPVVGRFIVAVGAVFGLLAVATSFLTLGENVKDQFHLDFKLPLPVAWIVSMGLPLLVYLLGARDFVGVLGFVGAVFGVIDGLLITLMGRHLIRGRLRIFFIPLIVVFLLGLVSEVLTIIK